MLGALRGAAAQGVAFTLIVPERIDSVLVRYASRAYYDDLLEAGVRITCASVAACCTRSGTVDGDTTMFGTVNLDMRSLWLNYEVTLFVYDDDFTKQLRDLQARYMADSFEVDPEAWLARGFGERLADNAFRLVRVPCSRQAPLHGIRGRSRRRPWSSRPRARIPRCAAAVPFSRR